MKLDLAFVKELLEELENNDTFFVDYLLNREERDQDKMLGHLFVMEDAQLIKFASKNDESGIFYPINNLRITYNGYLFLEAS